MPVRFEEVVKNKLYRGGEPSIKDLKMLKDVFGINKIVSLDQKIGDEIDSFVKKLSMEHVTIGLGSGKSHNVKRLEKYIPHLLDNGPVYIHCKHGKDRTGMAVAMFRVWSGEGLAEALKEAESFGMGKGLSPEVERSYYEAVEKYAEKNIDKNDADIVEISREPSSVGPAINDSSVPNFGQSSFAPFEDPTASRLSRIASFERLLELEKLAKTDETIYIQVKDINSILRINKIWHKSKQAAIKSSNNNGTIFSAKMYPNAKIENVNSKMSDIAVNYYLMREGLDFVVFNDGKVLVLSPNMLVELKEEGVDQNDLILDVGVRDNYGGSSSMNFSPGGGSKGEGGFAGNAYLPFMSGL